jgi:hypothetical protein
MLECSMRRPRAAAAMLALASLLLSATVASAGPAGARYRDPRGDYTRPPRYIVHPDIISLRVTNTASSLQFDINFARAPRELNSVDVLLDTDPHRAPGIGGGRFRRADVRLTEDVFDAYRAGTRKRAWVYIAAVVYGPVAWVRASARSVHVTFPSRFVISDSKQRKHKVVIPRRFRFFVWAWATENVDRYLPDEDLAPNSGWFTYRMS